MITLLNAPITALEVPAEIYDRIVSMLRKHSGVDGDAFPFLNAEPAKLKFQGCHVIRQPSKLEAASG